MQAGRQGYPFGRGLAMAFAVDFEFGIGRATEEAQQAGLFRQGGLGLASFFKRGRGIYGRHGYRRVPGFYGPGD